MSEKLQHEELADLRDGVAALDELLKAGGIKDIHFHVGQVKALLEENKGLKERVKFTQDYETLRYQNELMRECLQKLDERLKVMIAQMDDILKRG